MKANIDRRPVPTTRDTARAEGRNPFWATTLPAGHFDARKAAETLDFFGPLWHMEDTAP